MQEDGEEADAAEENSSPSNIYCIPQTMDMENNVQTYSELAELILSGSKQLGIIAADFLEIYKMSCQLSVGSALVCVQQFLTSATSREQSFVISRIIIIYLLYRVRDLDNWLKRKSETDEHMKGHIFLEFFLKLATEGPTDIIGDKFTPRTHPVESKMARIILNCSSDVFEEMTAEEVFRNLTEDLFTIASTSNFDTLSALFDEQSKRWPKNFDSNGIPACLFKNDAIPSNNIVEMSYDDAFQMIKNLVTIAFDQLPSFSVKRNYGCISLGMETWAEPSPMKRVYKDSGNQATNNKRESEVMKMSMEATLKSIMYTQNTSVDVEVGNTIPKNDTDSSFLLQIAPKLLSGEPIPSNQLAYAYECMRRAKDDHPFFIEIKDIPPIIMNGYIEQNNKFSSELIYRILKNDNSKISLFLLAMMEMAFSVQCVEIVLRLYKTILSLPSDILLEYFNYLMSICDLTTSSSQKARYVRIFSSFVISILNDGLLQDFTSQDIKSCFHQIQAFALRNNEYKEATGLYQKIQEVLRKFYS